MDLVAELNIIAEEEIEEAALRAAKEAVKEIGGELAYEKTLRERWQAKAASLDSERARLVTDLEDMGRTEKSLRQALAVEISVIVTAVILIALVLIL
ncbi:MAG: hypothetical protein K5930_11375 [Treponemataceae bacterium]|nr:hypothetical protein [Treponemataceae bacterium]